MDALAGPIREQSIKNKPGKLANGHTPVIATHLQGMRILNFLEKLVILLSYE